jgi:hypothetical protein
MAAAGELRALRKINRAIAAGIVVNRIFEVVFILVFLEWWTADGVLLRTETAICALGFIAFVPVPA